MYGLVVIRLSIKVYNPAAAGSTLDSLVISAWHASAATGVDPRSIPPPGVILLIAKMLHVVVLFS
jgi:hypothetical protein